MDFVPGLNDYLEACGETDPRFQYIYLAQMVVLMLIYAGILGLAIYNMWFYIIKQRKYKIFPLLFFYVLIMALVVVRFFWLYYYIVLLVH